MCPDLHTKTRMPTMLRTPRRSINQHQERLRNYNLRTRAKASTRKPVCRPYWTKQHQERLRNFNLEMCAQTSNRKHARRTCCALPCTGRPTPKTTSNVEPREMRPDLKTETCTPTMPRTPRRSINKPTSQSGSDLLTSGHVPRTQNGNASCGEK